ncbi:MAG: vitamin K epoxide reductase family protein, partial [Anaerolineales bacterium]
IKLSIVAGIASLIWGLILILWLLTKLDLPEYDHLIKMALWILTLFGILFSIYLTFLEPFVIGASCMWCLTSAVIMTSLFLLATRELNAQTQEL